MQRDAERCGPGGDRSSPTKPPGPIPIANQEKPDDDLSHPFRTLRP